MSSPKNDQSSTEPRFETSMENKSPVANLQSDVTDPESPESSGDMGIKYHWLNANTERSDEEYSSDRDSDKSSYSITSPEISWGPNLRTLLWIQEQKCAGVDPRKIILQALGNRTVISENISEITLWDIVAEILTDPPRRHKLQHINTIEDVVQLLRNCNNIMILTGAGVSVSCGIPDFRSQDGVYSRLAKEFPSLADPQLMFDIQFFSRDPRPFYQFAREIYPGQFEPSTCHRFIKMLEDKGKLLRNYTQNIDTLERVAGIRNLVECHGSFATATCTKCKYKSKAEDIRSDIFAQRIPMCPVCKNHRNQNIQKNDDDAEILSYNSLVEMGIMKPDIVFFGEGLGGKFHKFIANDKTKCDMLIVIGSSLRVHPVALIPRSIPPSVPQILINRERLSHMDFDVQLLGDSDTIVTQLCYLLGEDFKQLCEGQPRLTITRNLKPCFKGLIQAARKKPESDLENDNSALQSLQSGLLSSTSLGSLCDSGFESTSSSLNISTSILVDRNAYIDNSYESCQYSRYQPFTSKQPTGETSLKRSFTYSSDNNQYEMGAQISSAPCIDEGLTTTNDSPSSKSEDSRNGSVNVAEANTNGGYVEMNLADFLPDGTFYSHCKNGVYVFPGAQAYLSSDSESSIDSGSEEEESNNESTSTINDRFLNLPYAFEIVPKKRKRLDSDEYEDYDEYEAAKCDFEKDENETHENNLSPTKKLYLNGF